MVIFKFKDDGIYILGRGFALSTRPLILLAVNNFGNNDIAADIAIVFILVTLAMAVSGFDTHRIFYKNFFGERLQVGIKRQYQTYVATVVFQILCIAPLLATYLVYAEGSVIFAILVIVYLASERLADESQRFLIFDRRRSEWGWRVSAKSFLQLSGVVIVATLVDNFSQNLVIFPLILGNIAAFIQKVKFNYFPIRYNDFKSAFYACQNQIIFWFLSSTSIFISYLDRVAIMVFQKADIAAYTIMVSALSIMINMVDYFFISFYRQEILQNKLSLHNVFFSKRFLAALAGGAVAGVGACYVMLYLYYGKPFDSWGLLLIVFGNQIILSFTLIVREKIYWSYSINNLIIIEVGFILFSMLIFSLAYIFGLYYVFILFIIFIFYFARLGAMMVILR